MTYYVTPSLCVGDPPPFPHVECDDAQSAAEVIKTGGVALVSGWGVVVMTLRLVGVSDLDIDRRIRIARGR